MMMYSQLLLPALFLGVLFLTFFLQGWLQRRQREAAREVGPIEPPVLPRRHTLPPPRVMARRGTPIPAVAPRRAAHQRAPSRLGSLQDVRRGIVLMSILGPCRALEPPEPPR
jgi:hypothetical protein